MRKTIVAVAMLVLLVAVGGLVYANVFAGISQPSSAGFICPITGEELPCEKCCPLNQPKEEEGFICPLTGEELPCEKCCPLNQ